MSQNLSVGCCKWICDTSKFNEDLIKNFNEDSDIGYFLEVYVQCPEKLREFHNDLLFYQSK